MALTQDDRISISKKIVGIPQENEAAQLIQQQLEAQKLESQKADDANRALMNDVTTLIDPYQSELSRYDGNGRTVVTEANILNSANRIAGQSVFYPNDKDTPTPAIPDGVWKALFPYMGNHAIGREYATESFTAVTKEQDLIDAIDTAVAAVEAFSDPTRSTGLKCLDGVCSLPEYEDQVTCVNNGGTWTPGVTNLVTDTDMETAAEDLKTAVQAWEDFITATDALIVTTDSNATRSAENTASKDDIANAISVIDAWQSNPDYDTTTPTGATCGFFNGLTAGDFTPSKFRASELQVLKDELAARSAFILIRQPQIEGYLGTVTQDLSSGQITGGTGFYHRRALIIDMRLNAMAGTLSKLSAQEKGQAAQADLQASNGNAQTALTSIMYATPFKAPATNITSIHVADASGFSVSDSIYVVSDTQSELAATIEQIDGNRLVLDITVPAKYRHTEGARAYKLL